MDTMNDTATTTVVKFYQLSRCIGDMGDKCAISCIGDMGGIRYMRRVVSVDFIIFIEVNDKDLDVNGVVQIRSMTKWQASISGKGIDANTHSL